MEHDTGPEQDPNAPGAGGATGSDEAAADEEPATGEWPATGEASAMGERPATGEASATGEPRVDAALGLLVELDELPVTEHPQVYERIHTQLVEVLGELHSGPGPAGSVGPAGSGGSRGSANPSGSAAG
jgi:hypothetical protein